MRVAPRDPAPSVVLVGTPGVPADGPRELTAVAAGGACAPAASAVGDSAEAVASLEVEVASVVAAVDDDVRHLNDGMKG
jgi:hypothetical protein